MSVPQTLDPALIRAFATIVEEGSFTRAAERIGRTQSAVSLQVQRLEAMLGQTLLLRGKGGQVHVTSHGRYLLEQGRELLALNDKIWTSFRAPAIQGVARLGCPDDYALRFLPAVLRRFARSHPAVDVDVTCLPSRDLMDHLVANDLDLMICTQGNLTQKWRAAPLWRGPLRWITSIRYSPHKLDPLPLALGFETEQCNWRQMALSALETEGRAYRIAYTSSSLAGTYAPVLAGLAVTISNITTVPDGLRVMPDDGTLPPIGQSGIDLLKAKAPRQPVTDVLADHIAETFRAETV